MRAYYVRAYYVKAPTWSCHTHKRWQHPCTRKPSCQFLCVLTCFKTGCFLPVDIQMIQMRVYGTTAFQHGQIGLANDEKNRWGKTRSKQTTTLCHPSTPLTLVPLEQINPSQTLVPALGKPWCFYPGPTNDVENSPDSGLWRRGAAVGCKLGKTIAKSKAK